MNLEDVIDPKYGLLQDDWSLTHPMFGDKGQLQVIGWSGRLGKAKYYILTCIVCKEDTDLFGEGFFRSLKTNLSKGKMACGCSHTRWSKEQYTVLCSRKATQMGYIFLGFYGEWNNQNTKVTLSCTLHGDWVGGSINDLINSSRGCPTCGRESIAKAMTKPDSEMIQAFFDSGAFHPDTKFWRSDRLNRLGYKPYWNIYCPVCDESGTAPSVRFRLGQPPCACSKHRQQQCYINWVTDGVIKLALKFGISVDSVGRVRKQNSKSVYDVEQYQIYDFPSVEACKQAERECKSQMECGILSKFEMPDGFTETTYPYNVDKIIEIYERNGGILNDNQE